MNRSLNNCVENHSQNNRSKTICIAVLLMINSIGLTLSADDKPPTRIAPKPGEQQAAVTTKPPLGDDDDAQRIIGRWRLTQGAFSNEWWGHAGVLDSNRAGDRMDVIFNQTECTQYRSKSGWRIPGPDPTIVFTLADKTEQKFQYQLEKDMLIIRSHGTLYNDDRVYFRRVLDLKSPETIPIGHQPLSLPHKLYTHSAQFDWNIGDRVDVVLSDFSGILISNVPIHAISGPQVVQSVPQYDLTILVPDAMCAEWKRFRSKTFQFELVTAGSSAGSEVVTAEEIHSLLTAMTELNAIDKADLLNKNPALASARIAAAAAKIPEWANVFAMGLWGPLLGLAAENRSVTTESQSSFPTTPAQTAIKAAIESAEEECHKAASRYREIANAGNQPKELSAAAVSLESKVKAAFELRWQLQDKQIKQTKAEIARLETTHQRRKRLADQVIDRRVEEFKNGDDLSWTQQSRLLSSTEIGTRARPNGKPLEGFSGDSTKTPQPETKPESDPQIEGEWKLVSDVAGVLQPNSRLQVKDGSWALGTGGRNQQQRIAVNTKVTPHQIDLAGRSAFSDVYSGIYKVDDDVLTIAWAAHDGTTARPTVFLSGEGNIQVWKRVEPLPKFATPEDLLAYYDTIEGIAAAEKHVRLLTDKEAPRYAGLVIASAGTMTRMMPLMTMSAQMGGDAQPEMARFAKVAAFLQSAVSPTAPPQCVQAFNELTKPDMSFLTGQFTGPTTDPETFSEKLRLAGGAVDDPRTFTVQLLQLMDGVGVARDSDKEDKPKPDWVVSRDGDKAIAVNQTADRSDGSMSGNLELVRVDGTWKISKFTDDASFAEFAKAVSSPMMGTDSDGNEVPLSSVFGGPLVDESEPTPQEFLTLETALKERRFTDVDMTERLNYNSAPFGHEGDGVFPEFLPEYLSTVCERLKPDPSGNPKNVNWGSNQLELLRSVDPAIQYAKVGNEWDLKRFGKLVERFVDNASSDDTVWPKEDSPWSADMLSRIARTTGQLPAAAFTTETNDPDVKQRLQLLETMVRNEASSTWIDQEKIRLHNLLLEAPVETVRLLVEYPAASTAFEYKQWLFVLSKKEFSEALKREPRSCGQPVDTVLLTLILSHLSGTSEAIDNRIANILNPSITAPDPIRGGMTPSSETRYITRQLHDLLSNDYAYRQFVVDALVEMYRKSKSESLRLNIAIFAPSIPVLAKQAGQRR